MFVQVIDPETDKIQFGLTNHDYFLAKGILSQYDHLFHLGLEDITINFLQEIVSSLNPYSISASDQSLIRKHVLGGLNEFYEYIFSDKHQEYTDEIHSLVRFSDLKQIKLQIEVDDFLNFYEVKDYGLFC